MSQEVNLWGFGNMFFTVAIVKMPGEARTTRDLLRALLSGINMRSVVVRLSSHDEQP